VVPDDFERAVAAVRAALGALEFGARTRRFDAAARRWVTGEE
jgi:hypothetical protein